jgi:hypothetical protein
MCECSGDCVKNDDCGCVDACDRVCDDIGEERDDEDEGDDGDGDDGGDEENDAVAGDGGTVEDDDEDDDDGDDVCGGDEGSGWAGRRPERSYCRPSRIAMIFSFWNPLDNVRELPAISVQDNSSVRSFLTSSSDHREEEEKA